MPDFYLNTYLYIRGYPIRAYEVQPAWRVATPVEVPLVKLAVTGDHLVKINTGKNIGGHQFWLGP